MIPLFRTLNWEPYSMLVDMARCAELSASERRDMYGVFSRYYENTTLSRFTRDLDAKDWIILLREPGGNLVGFTTAQCYTHAGATGPAVVLYSGDTIVERDYRTTGDLAGAFGHLLLRVVAQNVGVPAYWLLTSKGVRTYRFLPVFFHTFFPSAGQEGSLELAPVLDEIAGQKFGDAYSPLTHVISHRGQHDRLCDAEHDPSLLNRNDAHIRFFLERNPGYREGDELACLTPLSRDNLNRCGRRVIQHTEVHWRE
jgi:hypothetical protein